MTRRRSLRWAVTALAVGAVLAVPTSGVRAHSDPATEIEKLVGKELDRAIRSSEGTETDPLLLPWARQIGATVSAQSPRRSVNYTFNIAQNDIANAFALPGGYIFITRGMLDEVGSDDELACVLGHESGHVAEKHAQKEIGESIAFLALMTALGSSKYDNLRTGASIINVLATLSLSRSYEEQADHVGIGFAYQSGYDPRGLVEFFKPYADEKSSALERDFDTHPTAAARIADALKNPLVTKPTPEIRETVAAGFAARGLDRAADQTRRGVNALLVPIAPPLPNDLPDYVTTDRADMEKRVADIRKHLHSAGKPEEAGSILQQVLLLNTQPGDLRWVILAAEAYALQENVDNLYARTLRVINVATPTFDSLATSAAAAPEGRASVEAVLGRSEIRGALQRAAEAPGPIRDAATAVATVLLDLNNRFYQPRGAASWYRYGADAGLLAYANSELARADKSSGTAWREISVARVRRYQQRLNVLIPEADPARRKLWFDLAQRRFGAAFPDSGPTGDATVRGALAIELGASATDVDAQRKDATWADWVLKDKGSPENVATAMRLLTLDLERETAATDRTD